MLVPPSSPRIAVGNPEPGECERDEVYFWDTVQFSVQGRLFQVPRYHFVQGSEYFAEKYLSGTESCNEVYFEADEYFYVPPETSGPIFLEGVTVSQFRAFLEVLYPLHPRTRTTTNLSLDAWLSVLALSTLWWFNDLRDLAIKQLESGGVHEGDPFELIRVGRAQYIPDWVMRGYAALALRPEAISEEESLIIGQTTTIKLYIIRHELGSRGRRVSECIKERFENELQRLAEEANSRRVQGQDKTAPTGPPATRSEPDDNEDERSRRKARMRREEEESRRIREEQRRRAREKEERERREEEEEQRRRDEDEEKRKREEELKRRMREEEEEGRRLREEERRLAREREEAERQRREQEERRKREDEEMRRIREEAERNKRREEEEARRQKERQRKQPPWDEDEPWPDTSRYIDSNTVELIGALKDRYQTIAMDMNRLLDALQKISCQPNSRTD